MKDYEEMQKAIKAFEGMSPEYRRATLLKMLHDQMINMADAISSYGTYLEEYKENAKHDMYRLSECGLHLARKEIKKIPKIKSDNARQLAIAQANTLLQGGGLYGTKSGKELASCVDMSQVDHKWYERSWALNNPLVNLNGKGGK